MAPEQILAALQKLDVNNDAHWTQDGMPRLETVRLFAGNQALTRENITSVAADFTRLAAYNAAQAAQAPPAPVAAPTPETTPAAQDTQAPTPPVADPAPPAPVVEATVQDERELTNQERLEVLQEEIADLDKYLAEAKKHRAALQLQADDLIIKIEKETPKHSNDQDIRSYLNSQNKQLQRRAEQIANVKRVENELGAKLSDFAPRRAPIDSAMARKTGYGRKRPGT